jgi:hypothetical protein
MTRGCLWVILFAIALIALCTYALGVTLHGTY